MSSLFDSDTTLCCDPASADTYKKRIKVAAAFCAERHRVYLRKEIKKEDKPWTNDWIMRSFRFCNIYRSLDRVTLDIMSRWVNPQLENPNIGLVAIFGRVINLPSTLDLLTAGGFTFEKKPNSERMFSLFNKIKSRGDKLVTGAYIVNTVFPKDWEKMDGSKADYLANFLAPELWDKRHIVAEGLASGSFRQTIEAMKKVHGIGAFVGNQAAVDLSYTKILKNAKDLNTTWNPGPGTCKGIRWVTGDRTLNPGSEKMDKALTQYREDLNNELSKLKLWRGDDQSKMKTGLVALTAPDASNSLCELQKFCYVAIGERKRLKQRYPGA